MSSCRYFRLVAALPLAGLAAAGAVASFAAAKVADLVLGPEEALDNYIDTTGRTVGR